MPGNKRPHIPNAIRHQVWQRNKGRCAHDFDAGNLVVALDSSCTRGVLADVDFSWLRATADRLAENGSW